MDKVHWTTIIDQCSERNPEKIQPRWGWEFVRKRLLQTFGSYGAGNSRSIKGERSSPGYQSQRFGGGDRKCQGFENPTELQAKADLALRIIRIVEERGLTQEQAAGLVGATQPDISKLKGGQLKGFTLDRLFSFLLKLDKSIEIRVTKPRSKEKTGVLQLVLSYALRSMQAGRLRS